MASPAIGLRSSWAPGLNASINWSHPLSQRLTVLAVAYGPFWKSFATGSIAQYPSINPPRATPFGLGYDHSGNTASNANPRISGFTTHTGSVTWFAAGLYTGVGTSAFKGILGIRSGTLHGLASGVSASVINLWYNTSESIVGPILTVTTPVTIVGSVSTDQRRLTINDSLQTTTGQAAAALTGPMEIGGDNFGASNRPWIGTLNIVGMSLRQWSLAEELMFKSDPFCMLRH